MEEKEKQEFKGLTAKQQLFCHEYLLDLNASAAYKRAGYTAASKSAIAVGAHQILRNPNIQEYIAILREERKKQTDLKGDDVINQLKAIAFSSISNVVESWNDEGVVMKDAEDIDSVSLSAIQSISVRGGRVHVKMHDKTKALATLVSVLGLDNDFSKSVLTLASYGLKLYRDGDGKWQIRDESVN
jgi:phage terminase small subunit